MSGASFFALCAAVFAVAFGYAAIMPVLPDFLGSLLPAARTVELAWHAGAFAGVYMLAVVVFSPVWGAASDRHGAKPVLLLGLAGSAVAVSAVAFADSLWTAYLGRALQGAFASAVLPAANSMLARIADTAQRARKVSSLGAATLLGFFVAPAVSAALISLDRTSPVATVLYVSAAVALVACIVMFWLLVGPPASAHRPAAGGGRSLPGRFLALNLIAYLGLGAFEVALPLAARGPLGIDAAQVSLLFMECSIFMIVAQGGLSWAAPLRAHFPKVLIGGIAAYSAGLLWLSKGASFVAALSAVGLIALAAGLVLPLIAFLATLEIETRPGAELGRLAAAGGLGQAVGSLSGGALYGHAGMAMFTLTALAVGVGGWLASRSSAAHALGGRRRRTRT